MKNEFIKEHSLTILNKYIFLIINIISNQTNKFNISNNSDDYYH